MKRSLAVTFRAAVTAFIRHGRAWIGSAAITFQLCKRTRVCLTAVSRRKLKPMLCAVAVGKAVLCVDYVTVNAVVLAVCESYSVVVIYDCNL